MISGRLNNRAVELSVCRRKLSVLGFIAQELELLRIAFKPGQNLFWRGALAGHKYPERVALYKLSDLAHFQDGLPVVLRDIEPAVAHRAQYPVVYEELYGLDYRRSAHFEFFGQLIQGKILAH